jgi:hypothetical protein
MNGKEFGEWLDENGVDVTEAARLFGVSEGSVYKWRSTLGVPPRKLEWVRAQMAAFEKRESAPATLDRLVLEITDEQLRSYLNAAADEGLYIKDWAVHVLDKAAEADGDGDHGAGHVKQPSEPYDIGPVQMPRAAEESSPEYSEKKEPA